MSGDASIPQIDVGAFLAALAVKPEVKNMWFNKQEVKLDGYRFVGCRFDSCVLHVSTSSFEIENCFIDKSTGIYYSHEQAKIIKLFNTRSEWMDSLIPSLVPVRNQDGTITIK